MPSINNDAAGSETKTQSKQKVNESEDFNLTKENEQLKKVIEEMKAEQQKMKKSMYYLKRKNSELTSSINDFKLKVESLTNELNISNNLRDGLKNCASEIPSLLFEMTAKKGKGSRTKEFHPSIKKFALTFQLASAKAYRILRKEFEDALPAERTVRTWCSRNFFCHN